MDKYLALDIGDVRIGVAKSDSMGIIAMPLTVINRKKEKSTKRILQLCELENTYKIVVGIPKSLDGTEKVQAEKVRAYIEKLKKLNSKIEIYEVDERYTTVSADKILEEQNIKGALNKRKYVDKIAASIILQNFLNINRKNLEGK